MLWRQSRRTVRSRPALAASLGIAMLFGIAFFVFPGGRRLEQNHLFVSGAVVLGEDVLSPLPALDNFTGNQAAKETAANTSAGNANERPRNIPPPALASLVLLNPERSPISAGAAAAGGEGDEEDQAFYLDVLPTIQGVAFFESAMPATQKLLEHGERYDYTVEEGDTPGAIAELFGISLETLLWANNLTARSIIKPGQTLTVLPVNGVEHVVVKGDTIASLAKKYNAVSEEILAFNNLEEGSSLEVGVRLVVPNGIKPPPPAPKVVAIKPTVVTRQSSPVVEGWLIAPAPGRNPRGGTGIHGFNGIDISNTCGTPIVAAAAGTVIVADGVGWNGGYGKYIKIQHPNGIITLYGHARELLVGAGVEIAQGQGIALMGTTGRSTGCHVHFEVRGAKNPFAGRKSF